MSGSSVLVPPFYMPPIVDGLRFVAPLRSDAKTIHENGIAASVAPTTEAVDAVGTYLDPTTGLITQAEANVLRIEKDGGRLEGARKNEVFPSSDFSDARWAKTNAAVDSDSHTLPDAAAGTVNELRATAANGTIIQDLGVIASSVKTFSIYLKRKTGTGDIDITLDGGSTWTTVSVTASWTRFEKTQTLADPDVGIRIVTSGDEVIAWGAQLEEPGNARSSSSHIPTTGAAVTRAVDQLAYASSGHLAGASPFTIVLAVSPGFASSSPSDGAYVILDTTNAPSNWGTRLRWQGWNDRWEFLIRNGTATQSSILIPSSFGLGDVIVLAATANTNDFKFYENGVLGGTDVVGSLPAAHAPITIGSGNAFAGHILGNLAHVLIYDRVLLASEITTLTSAIQSWMGIL